MLELTPPGGGPPPHSHSREDEVFTVLEGEYELLSEGQWIKVPVGEPVFGPRGHVHTFRNLGSTPGQMMIFISPAGIEKFFEKLSGLSVPADMPRIEELFAEYGLTLHLS
jgi:quercetin dioxygenase-like cupin family protein